MPEQTDNLAGLFVELPARQRAPALRSVRVDGSRRPIAELVSSKGSCEMSFVIASPTALAGAASDVAGIGSALGAASAAAAGPTTGVLAAAGDEVSAQIAGLFSAYGLGYQQLSARVSAFHEQFAQALTAGASVYTAAEADIAHTLANAVGAPAELLLARGAQEVGAVGQAAAPLLGPTGGIHALTSATALLSPAAMTAAAAMTPAANALAPIGNAVEAAYLAIEPYVQYGFQLTEWAASYILLLAPQITFYYNLFEPIAQAALFNTIDVLDQTITLSQGLSNFWVATTASINQFIVNETSWFYSLLPPAPPFVP
jgi:hypothetical protein